MFGKDQLKQKQDYLHPLIETLLNIYINKYIVQKDPPSAKVQAEWEDICNLILDDPYFASRVDTNYFGHSTHEALSRMIFVRYDLVGIDDSLKHISLFSDLITKWIKVVGHNPYAYSILLTMLGSTGWQFGPEQLIVWLSVVLQASANIEQLYKQYSNGERTARLLHRNWNSFEQKIRKNVSTLHQYSILADNLLSAGIPLASLLQKELENTH